MNALFTINFRREAYLQEVSRRRGRVISLGVWVAYFGVLLVLAGLYALNGVSLARRAHLLERQTRMIRNAGNTALGAKLAPSELADVEAYARSTRQWRDRLARLGDLIPPDSRLTGVQVNPHNMSDVVSRNSLLISGELRSPPGKESMQGVMTIVASLRADTVFAAGYRNIKLSSTRISEDGSATYLIECR